MIKIDSATAGMLDAEAARINSKAFIADDPVRFPREFTDLRDIEIVALVSAIMAWGNRKMICRDIERFIEMTDRQPYAFLMEGACENMDPDMNLHRTLFASHLQHLFRGLKEIYSSYPTLDAFAKAIHAGEGETPAWTLAEAIQNVCTEVNGVSCSRCLPLNMKQTALKRFNMALRWLVRDDGIVDMGVWTSIPKSKLYIPLDVHVGNTARSLGILKRRANDRRAVEDLTAALRTLRPDDPVFYDYALFGLGIEGKKN